MRRLPRPTGPSGPQLTAAARMTAACRWLHGPWLSARGARPWPCTEMLHRPSRSARAMLSSTPPMPPSRRSGAYVVRLYASPASGSGAASDQVSCLCARHTSERLHKANGQCVGHGGARPLVQTIHPCRHAQRQHLRVPSNPSSGRTKTQSRTIACPSTKSWTIALTGSPWARHSLPPVAPSSVPRCNTV
jgi:hypothetical protein